MSSIEKQRELVSKARHDFLARPPKPISEIQAPINVPARGNIWICQDVFRAPTDSNLQDLLYDVIDSMRTGTEDILPRQNLSISNVPFEWLGSRPNVKPDAKQPEIEDAEIYRRLLRDTKRSLVILYMHGGAFYSGGPVYVRSSTTKLAKLTNGRVASIAYRRCPPHEFPTPILDVWTSYLSLLYPSRGALHQAILSSSIVLAGDSVGGNLCIVLCQIIQCLSRFQGRQVPQVRFNGAVVDCPMPAGITLLSPVSDISLGLPSWKNNGETDVLQMIQPAHTAVQPVDEIWPSTPPRSDVYCHSSAFIHPLVSPCLATDWHGMPPMWVSCGQERSADGAKIVAQRAVEAGVPVGFTEYEGMPHIFTVFLSSLPQAKRCVEEWAKACVTMVEAPAKFVTGAKWIKMPGDTTVHMKLSELAPISHEEVLEFMKAASAARFPFIGPNTREFKL